MAVVAVALVLVMVHVASRRKRKRLPVHRALVYVLLFKRRKCVIVFGCVSKQGVGVEALDRITHLQDPAFKRLRATWISVEPRRPIFGTARKPGKKFSGRKN